MVVFDEEYYRVVIREHGYNPMVMKPISFGLRDVPVRDVKRKWICHVRGDEFSEALGRGRCVVTTGVGLSGSPHIGTLSQMMRAIFLQKSGLKVQFVLGDLDSYNARNQPLETLRGRVRSYSKFLEGLGFSPSEGILRSQGDNTEVLKTAYLISNCLTDADFRDAEEDLSALYRQKGIYPGIEFPVKQAILLMVADFIQLGLRDGYDFVLVMLGIEEHLYVQLAEKVVSRMGLPFGIAALYSSVIRGFSGYPKMSKSIPGSGIDVGTPADEVRRLIVESEGDYDVPENSVVFQMMSAVSGYSPDELNAVRDLCAAGGRDWLRAKADYAAYLSGVLGGWSDEHA